MEHDRDAILKDLKRWSEIMQRSVIPREDALRYLAEEMDKKYGWTDNQ